MRKLSKIMSLNIVIVDYGMGNLNSVQKKFKRLNTNPEIVSDPKKLLDADRIVLPGVGNFQKAMKNLYAMNFVDMLNECVLTNNTPILGICLGMQLMAKYSEEGNSEGLGWFDAEVVRFQVSNHLTFKIPHMGWNQIHKKKESMLMRDIPELSEFYFVHSFHFKSDDETIVLNTTEYDYEFISAVEKDNIFGVQYHPEKSHDVGEQLLKNFIEL